MLAANQVGRGSGKGLLIAIAIAVTTGCAPVAYRVSGLEVQRMAQLDPSMRGKDIRVVPRTAPLAPALPLAQLAPPEPPPAALPPPPPADPGPPPPGTYGSPAAPAVVEEDIVVTSASPPPVAVVIEQPILDVHLHGGGHMHAPPPVRVAPRPPTSVAVSGGTGGAWRGSPPTVVARPTAPTGSGGAWRGAPVVTPIRSGPGRATFSGGHRGGAPGFPRVASHGSGHRRGGGGGSNVGAAVAVGVAVVGLVAVAAVAAEHAQRVDAAHSFDGWVTVAANHPLRLHYPGNRVRIIPLFDLRIEDTIGLQYAVLRASEGEVQLGARATGVAATPPPPPAPPPYQTSN